MPTLPDLVQNYGVSEGFGVMGPYGEIHTGVDLLLPSGTPVPALGAGTIESVFQDAAGGTQVKVKYATGAEGWFAHLTDVYAQVGDPVGAQTVIGTSGATGHVTGPHLHFEERDPSGQLVDPLTDSAQTYIGGGSSSTAIGDPTCPIGYTWHADRGACVSVFDPNRTSPTGDSTYQTSPEIPGTKGIADAAGAAAAAAVNTAFGPVGKSIDDFKNTIGGGARQIAVAAVVIGIVAILGYAGLKMTLD